MVVTVVVHCVEVLFEKSELKLRDERALSFQSSIDTIALSYRTIGKSF